MSTRNRLEVYEARNKYRGKYSKERSVSLKNIAIEFFVKGLAFSLAFVMVLTGVSKLSEFANDHFIRGNGRYYYKSAVVMNATRCAVERQTVLPAETIVPDNPVFTEEAKDDQIVDLPEEKANQNQEEESVKKEAPVIERVSATVTPKAESKTVETVQEKKGETTDENTSSSDPYYGWTEEDYKYLLMTIVGEAQCCSKECQMYVGSVVLNRLNSTKYFNYAHCIKDVVLAQNQYSCFKDGNAYRTPTELNKEVAMELLKNGSVLPGNVLYQSQSARNGDGIYCQVGNEYFCYQD